MMSNEEIAKLMVSLEARTDQMDKAVVKSTQLFEKQLAAMEGRAATFSTRLDKAFGRAGQASNRLLAGAAAYLSFGAIKGFVESSVATVKNIEKQSEALNLSTDTFQEWSIAARKAGVDQEVFNTAIDRFAKNLGDARMKGTEFGKMLAELGVSTKGSNEEVFYRFVDAVNSKVKPDNRSSVLGAAMGSRGSGVQMAPFALQGSARIKAASQAAKEAGEVIDKTLFPKIDKLEDAWVDVVTKMKVAGVSALGGFADQISRPEFQTALKNLATVMGEIATDIAKMAPYLPMLAGVWAGAKVGRFAGPEGGVLGGIIGGVIGYSGGAEPSPKLADLKQQLVAAKADLKGLEDYWGKNSGDYHIADAKAKIADLQGQVTAATPAPAPAAPAGGGGGNKDLNLETSAFEKATRAMREHMAAMRDGTGAFADYTQAEEEATAKSQLLAAAQEDADKRGGSVGKAQIAQIESLASEYGKLAAQRSYAGDLRTEDDRIAKLQAEAAAAGATARQLAEIQTRETLLADFRKRFGDKAVPDTAQMGDINAKASAAGTAQAGTDFSKALDAAEKHLATVQGETQTIGLFGGALAAAQMRMELLNAAMLAGLPIDDAMMAKITALSDKFGQASQTSEDMTRTVGDQVAIFDELRNGMEGVFGAGLNGFKSMKTAAADFMMQLAQMILKLYVMQPIMESLLGKSGTTGGGLLGPGLMGVLGGIPGFASGTDSTPAGARWVGEHGPELEFGPGGNKILSHSASINALRLPSMPSASQMRTSTSVALHIEAGDVIVQGNTDERTLGQIYQAQQAQNAQLPGMIARVVTQMHADYAPPFGER